MIQFDLNTYQENPKLKTFDSVFAFIKNNNLRSFEKDKKHFIDERIFFTLMQYESKDIENCPVESHEKYIDIQMILEGKEGFGVTAKECVEIKEAYNTERDVVFYYKASKQDVIELSKNQGVVFFPGDVHEPGRTPSAGKNMVTKVVFKVPVV